MSQPKNYIEINGRKYHSQTGQLIDAEPVTQPVQLSPEAKASISMDGVIRRPQAQAQHHPVKPKKQHNTDNVARSVKHVQPKHVQKSTTLMRPYVQKPDHKVNANKHAPKQQNKIPDIQRIPHDRLERAEQIKQSPHIRRFHALDKKPEILKRQEHVPVVHQKNVGQHEQHNIQETIHQSVDQFEEAIHDATAHLETYVDEHKPKSYRKLAFATVSLSVIVLCGFVIYQSVPNVKVQMASNKAGFSADLPSYSPAGYGLNSDIQANSGEVTLAYNSRTDSKGYEVIQKPSNWNSQSLINNFLLAERKSYQTYENNGKTIYIYENTNATWIDGGIWYRVVGDASLTSDQLLRIANGL